MLLAMPFTIKILVDDATVVLKNNRRHLTKGKEKRVASFEGRMEICFSALLIVFVAVIELLPTLTLQIFIANILKQFSELVINSTLICLLVSFALILWLTSYTVKKVRLELNNFFDLRNNMKYSLNKSAIWLG